MVVIQLPENFTITDSELRVAKSMAQQEVKDAIVAKQTKEVADILVNNKSVDMIFVDVIKTDRQSGYVGGVREAVYTRKGYVPAPNDYVLFKQGADVCKGQYPMFYIQNGTTDSFNVAYVLAKKCLFVIDWWSNADGKLTIHRIA